MVRPAEKWSFLGSPENTRGPNWDLPVMSGPVSGSLGLDQHSRDLLSPPRDLLLTSVCNCFRVLAISDVHKPMSIPHIETTT